MSRPDAQIRNRIALCRGDDEDTTPAIDALGRVADPLERRAGREMLPVAGDLPPGSAELLDTAKCNVAPGSVATWRLPAANDPVFGSDSAVKVLGQFSGKRDFPIPTRKLCTR